MPHAKACGITESKDPYSIRCSHLRSSVSRNSSASGFGKEGRDASTAAEIREARISVLAQHDDNELRVG
jgi:hypothetical protein